MSYPPPSGFNQPLPPPDYYPPSGPLAQPYPPPSSYFQNTTYEIPAFQPQPAVVPSYPAGLNALVQMNQIIVKQQIELIEVMTGYETANAYTCMNTSGQIIFNCAEVSGFIVRQCLGSHRPFVIHILDLTGAEVIRVRRPYKCFGLWECCSCSDCCKDEVEIEAPVGQIAGYVKQMSDGCSIAYQILDANRKEVLRICGPCFCFCSCIGEDVRFPIRIPNSHTEVGLVCKKWTNIVQEFLTDADTFSVSFPLDLDVRIKAVLVGAVFLIDFMYFEDNQASDYD